MKQQAKNNILFAKLLIHISRSDENFDNIEIELINKFILDKKIKQSDFRLMPNFKHQQIIDDLPKQYLIDHKNIIISLIAIDNQLNINEGAILKIVNEKISN